MGPLEFFENKVNEVNFMSNSDVKCCNLSLLFLEICFIDKNLTF